MIRFLRLLMVPVVALSLSAVVPTASAQEKKEGDEKAAKKKGGKKKG